MQINRTTWEPFFQENYGVPWERIVLDDETNFWAACIIWQRNGWSAWSCSP